MGRHVLETDPDLAGTFSELAVVTQAAALVLLVLVAGVVA